MVYLGKQRSIVAICGVLPNGFFPFRGSKHPGFHLGTVPPPCSDEVTEANIRVGGLTALHPWAPTTGTRS